MILKKDGSVKPYIYETDIRRFLQCSSPKAKELFQKAKDLELETYQYEMFENRVPQEVFHTLRKKKRGKNND